MNTPELAGFRAERRDAGQDDINRLIGELQRRERVWLVFDNLETILDDRYFHDVGMDLLFTSLRGSMHNAKIIITSRVLPLLKNGESLIDVIEEEKQELKGLKLNFAVDFLVKNGLEGLEHQKLEELATGVDGHPLALRLLIELVKKFGISDTLNDLSRYQKHKENTIKKARRLFEKLAGDEKELLERLSVFRRPEIVSTLTVPVTINQPTQSIKLVFPFKKSTVIVHDAIKMMFTDRTSEDLIEKLMDKSLLETDHEGNYWLHPLIREFSYDDLKNKKEIHHLACLYYISLKLPDELIRKDDVQSLIEACYHACKAEKYDEAARIIFAYKLNEDLNRWGESRTLVELYTGMLPKNPLRDKPLLSDKRTHSWVLGSLGVAYRDLGQVDKAIQYYDQALAIAKEIGDRKDEGAWLGDLGLAYSDLGQVEKAIQYYEKALAIAKEIGDRKAEGAWLGNLGGAYSDLGQVEKAIQYYEKALAVSQEIGERGGEGNDLGSLGLAYRDLGQVDKAIQYYDQALAIAQEIGDRKAEGAWLGNLGNAYRDLGQVDKAIQYYDQALAIAKEIGDRKAEGAWLGDLGLAYSDLGQVEKAIQYYEKALAIAKEIGDRKAEGAWLGDLGVAYSALGQVEKAIQYHEKALAIAQEIGDRRNEGIWLNNLGVVFIDKEKYREALACLLLAKGIRIEIKDPNLKTTVSHLKNLKKELGENEFEKLTAEASPRVEEIVRKMLEPSA